MTENRQSRHNIKAANLNLGNLDCLALNEAIDIMGNSETCWDTVTPRHKSYRVES